MMKKFLNMATATVVCTGLLFTSCKKKEVEDNDTAGGGYQALGETHSNDITNIGTQASYNNMSTYKLGEDNAIYSTCATIDLDTLINTDADTMTVDFGSGCLGGDGRTRKGVLRFIYSAGKRYRDSACVINVSTPGNTYYVLTPNGSGFVTDHVIVNSKTITNNGHSLTNGYLTWTITSDMKVDRDNGNSVSWTSSKTKVLIAGEKPNNLPIDWPNAKVAIYGSASGSYTKAGNAAESFSMSVQQAKWLVRDFKCSGARRFFVQGELEFTPGNKPTRYVNFGSGNCDNTATVTINGNVYNITLH